MKILFVCWANVGRSQMAAAFYNDMTHTRDASSAGTDVDVPGETLLERRERLGETFTIAAMLQEGIDLSGSKRTQVTEAMLDDYDQVISMAQLEYTPAWLGGHPKYTYWEVADPGGANLEMTITARDVIKAMVAEFVKHH